MTTSYPRLNIYLDDPEIRTRIKIAAAHEGVSLSSYCLQAIRDRLETEDRPYGTRSGVTIAPDEGSVVSVVAEPQGRYNVGEELSPVEAARSLDRLRREIGPIGVPVAELIREGRE